jgi:hypothetical protein
MQTKETETKMKKSLFMLLVMAPGLLVANHAIARVTYTAYKAQRGTTVNIPESVINSYCGDGDGCEMRLGMYNWDGSRRTASRIFYLWYDWNTTRWRTSSDKSGTNHWGNNATEHAYQAWSCYLTDGKYINWSNVGDITYEFGLLSWNQYNADCKLTIID